jgi:Uri superfamily endonuclease
MGNVMIYFSEEGANLRNGVHFYPVTSTTSLGFRLRINRKLYQVRYSKVAKRWFIGRSAI